MILELYLIVLIVEIRRLPYFFMITAIVKKYLVEQKRFLINKLD